ncbi:MAG: hypothetical protein ACTHWH_12015 [Marinobacter sp.]
MKNKQEVSLFSDAAFKITTVEPMPEGPVKRAHVGDELQPFGSYANANPYHGSVQDVEAVQEHEPRDPEFKDKDWWWDHQRIRFLNGKFSLKFLILIIPFIWIFALVLGGLTSIVLGVVHLSELFELPGFLYGVLVLVLALSWLVLAFWIIPPTTNWLMSTGIGFFLKPFEKIINKKLDGTLEDGCSEFNRVTGQVRFALGRKRFFEAPFIEFDAYVERVVQKGGFFYRLMFVHRYTQKTFNKTWLSSIEAEKAEVLALWDMLQRYMDVSQPLPDVPRLEPFRHLDPMTHEHDKKTGRNPRYWRDLNLEEWKAGEGQKVLLHQRDYPWGSRVCKLTPQLGKISMEEYRKQRPAGASPI